MADISISDAAVSGFRVVRERPRALLIWMALQVAFRFAYAVIMIQTAGPGLAALSVSRGAGSRADPAQVLAALQQVAPFYLLSLALSLLVYAVVFSAINRAVLTPDDEGFAYLRLGADELRQLGLVLLLLLVGVAAYFLFAVVLGVIIGVAAAVTGARPGAGLTALSVGFAVIAGLAAFGAWIYVWVRLSLASPLTFATRRIDLFGSWRLTRGRFWPMFGAYVVATLLALIVVLLSLVITSAMAAAVGGGITGLTGLFRPDVSSLGAYLTPARLASLVVGSAALALVYPVLLAPAAAIYRSLPEAAVPERTAAAFD